MPFRNPDFLLRNVDFIIKTEAVGVPMRALARMVDGQHGGEEEQLPSGSSRSAAALSIDGPQVPEEGAEESPEEGMVLIGNKRVLFATARFGAHRAAFPEAMLTVVASPRKADAPLRNADALRGNVAVVLRGGCSFCEKAERVQAAGAAAVVFVNTDDELFAVAPGEGEEELAASILLPIVLVRQRDGSRLLAPAKSIATRPSVTIRYERLDDSDSEIEGETDEEDGDGDGSGGVAAPPLMVGDLLQEVRLAAARRRPKAKGPRRTRSPQ